MSTPYSGSNSGYLKKSDKSLIQVPGLIKEMKEEWRGLCSEAYTDGYLTGWTNSSDQYTTGDPVKVVEYILKRRGTPSDVISDALNALREILPKELQTEVEP